MPHLDKLWRARGAVHAGVCHGAGLRAEPVAFLTGMYQTSVNLHHFPDHRDDGFRLPEGVKPLTHRLKDADSLSSIEKIGKQVVGK